MKTFDELLESTIVLNEAKLFSFKPSGDQKKRLKALSDEIADDMGTTPDKEFDRTMAEFKKELNNNELAKFANAAKDSSATFKTLKSKGVNIDKLEQEFDKLGYRGVVSRTAGIDQIYFEPEKAIEIAIDQVIEKLEKTL